MSRPPADCHPDREHLARGLCGECYRRARYDGTLDRHESIPRTPGAAVLRISRAYGVTLPDLLGDSTEPHLVDARRAAAHLLRDQLGLTQRAIAHWLGGRTRHHVLKLLADPPPRPSDPPPLPDDGTCHVHDCGRNTDHPGGLCAGHRARWIRDGDIRAHVPLRPIRDPDAPIVTTEGFVHDADGYNHGGCRCEDCRTAAVRAVKRNRHRPQTVPVDVGIAAIERLRVAGMSVPQMARAAGVMPNTLYGWLNRVRPVCWRSTVAKLDAVQTARPDLELLVTAPSASCEDCDADALGGGRWCLDHFRTHSRQVVAS